MSIWDFKFQNIPQYIITLTHYKSYC